MVDIERKLADLARNPAKKQTYLKCLSEDKRLGFKFDVQKENSGGSSLMKKVV